jgi:wyosine [tRNA(Phe)-imidazoG37] synthetase (radical SAM superfamily)
MCARRRPETRPARQPADPVPERLDPGALPPIAFGPVPSRRLGRSLGINNIPPKVCSYSCVYCQVGPTMERSIEPRCFYPVERIVQEVTDHLARARAAGEAIDYLTFVPDGEPTLDATLGGIIRCLRSLDIPIAVISNGSLLARPEVREAVGQSDWVSVKVDAATESAWERINRPHRDLSLQTVFEGIRHFAAEYSGRLVSETMLVADHNDAAESVAAVGTFLREAGIVTAYLAVPTRPTPYPAITKPPEESMVRAYHVLAQFVPRVEYLIGYEGDAFASTGNPQRDLLATTAVHPMRESAVGDLLARTGARWDVVEDLVDRGDLTEVSYAGRRYFVRRWRR